MSFRAFSLIELLVVVTIVAILSAISIPAYNRYIVRAHVIELLAVADTYKVKLIENLTSAASSKNSVYNLNTGVIATVSTATLATEPLKHVIQVVAKMQTKKQAGIGLAQPGTTKEPLTLQLQGTVVGEVIMWTCHVAQEYHDYVPGSCHNNDLERVA